MEMMNFIQTQISPLAIVCRYRGFSEVLSIMHNTTFNSGAWQQDDIGPCIKNLMSLDIVIENDLSSMSPEEIWDTHVVSLIAELPKSFYISDFTDEFVLEVSEIIRTQIVSFFDLMSLRMTIDGKQYLMDELLNSTVWTFRIRHGVELRPSVTIGGNLGLEVNYV